MERLTITDLSGGVIDAVDPRKIPDNCLVTADNYEYVNASEITRRKEIGTQLSINLPDISAISVWYPTNNLADNIGDKIYVVNSNSDILLWYQTVYGQNYQVVFSDAGSDVRFFVSSDRVLIADNLNPCRFISIDKDGNVVSANIGIPAPLKKLSVSLAGADNTFTPVDNVDIGMGRERGVILGLCYTVETDTGEESNPSPVNYEQRFMYKYLDADTDTGFAYYWARATYTGLKIPDVDEATQARLKYYNIYVTEIDYTSGTYGKSFNLVKRLAISDTQNQSYIDTSDANLKDIDYTNNIAPIAKEIVENNGVIFVGQIKEKIGFPFQFNQYTKITIDNQNDRDYVNAVIGVSIVASDVGLDSFNDLTAHTERYRIFHSDRVTPINVVYQWVSNTLRCYIRVPLLQRGATTIYFCYSDGSTTTGVTDDVWDSYNYGKFMSILDWDWDTQKVFDLHRPIDGDNILCLNGNMSRSVFASGSATVDNLANNSNKGTPTSSYTQVDDLLNKIKIFGAVVDAGKTYSVGAVTESPITYTALSTNTELTEASRITVAFKFGIYSGTLGAGLKDIVKIGTDFTIRYTYNSPNVMRFWLYGISGSNFIGELYIDTTQRTIVSGVVSCDMTGNGIYAKFYNTTLSGDSSSDTEIGTHLTTLTNGDVVILNLPAGFIYLSAVSIHKDMYLGGEDFIDKAINLLNAMPYYPLSWIGIKHTDGIWETNHNITFSETETVSNNTTPNEFRWSKIGRGVFPALYGKKLSEPILRIIACPSFLKQQYENTIIIFTRNTINRMVLAQDQDMWHTISQNVITEYNRFGLYAPQTLTLCGSNLFWLSETGVMRWNADGLVNISKSKINVPLSQDLIGFYVPSNMQYILHDNTTNTSYVFHLINGAWTTFSGLDIEHSVILDGGSDTGSDNVFVSSTALLNTYPSDETVSSAQIVTKRYPIKNSKIIRARIDADTMGTATGYTENAYQSGIGFSLGAMDRMVWQYVGNGVWGEYCQIQLDNIDGFRSIEIDTQRMGV